MEEDFEKTIILGITVLIVWCFFISNNIKNPQIYFGSFLTLFFICLIQRQYLKKWTDDEEKTDYTLVYYFYNLLTVGIFLYLLFILGNNPKLKVLKGGSYNPNMINPDMLNIDISNQETIKDKILQFIRNVLNKGIGGLASGFSLYTRFWKKLIHKIIGIEETNI
jgi:hypothetical protein